MANNKTGFIYYSVETDRYQDIRIKRLKKECGCTGLAVYDYLLCEIYRVKGCFLVWDESTVFDVSEYLGLKENTVREIVNYCCSVGLFSKELLTSGNILTSAAIQSRFIDWSKKAKRTNIKIPEECKIIPEESSKLQEQTPHSYRCLPQSKVKESKVKESKDCAPDKIQEDEIETTPPDNPPPVAPPPSRAGPTLEEVKIKFPGLGGTEVMAEKFWNKYDGLGWKIGISPILNWRSIANNFIANYKESEERDGDKTNSGGNKSPSGGKAFNSRNGGFTIVAGLLRNEINPPPTGGTEDNRSEIQI